MKEKKTIRLKLQPIIGILMVLFAVSFNLYLYRLEPTALNDPNDNSFQYALVHRTNEIWDFATRTCSASPLGVVTFPFCHFTYLVDHWVHNWAQGYNLPFYYSHIPQIVIVATHRIGSMLASVKLVPTLTLFQWYHIVIYLLLSLFPLPVFLGLRIIGASWIVSGFGAILASHISTDGLYGLDPPSFLWRGWGLSSQLFAMIWLPLSIGYAYKFFSLKQKETHLSLITIRNMILSVFPSKDDSREQTLYRRTFWLAVLFTVFTIMGHLGIGIVVLMSIGIIAITKPLVSLLKQKPLVDIWHDTIFQLIRLALLAGISIFFLSYWIIPVLLGNNYHNISWWDPVWKFDSYGWTTIVTNLFNGDLFDWGRKPWLTLLVFLGLIAPFLTQNTKEKESQLTKYIPFSLMFMFWLVMYFGRTTWGGLIDLIPSMTEYHLSRFIVGLHLTGLFLAPLGLSFIVESLLSLLMKIVKRTNSKIHSLLSDNKLFTPLITLALSALVIAIVAPRIYKQTIYYNDLNDRLIKQANENYVTEADDFQELMTTLRSLPPGRIYAGRGGWWGKDFLLAETPYYMEISAYGLPTVSWLPETWSLNSDTEQYFSDERPEHYEMYNIAYVAAPPEQEIRDFWEPVAENPNWKLYKVPTQGYITVGTMPATVTTGKTTFINIVRNWIKSDLPEKNIFPELIFENKSKTPHQVPLVSMVDEATYNLEDGLYYSLFESPPPFNSEPPEFKLFEPEEVDTDMVFRRRVLVEEGCQNCLVILRQTTHPNWVVKIDGKRVKHTNVFPFYIGAPITPGEHVVEFAYKPGRLKVFLLAVEIIALIGLLILFRKSKKSQV